MPPLDKRQYLKMPEDPNVLKYDTPDFGKLYGIDIARGADAAVRRSKKIGKEKDDAKRLTKALNALVRK